LCKPLTLLFNKILASGNFPENWRTGLIVAIYKKGDKENIENYRGITLLSAIGKLFTSILNQRLYSYLVNDGIIKHEQLGFRKKHSTIDGIFLLKNSIDLEVKYSNNRKSNMLFSCFVDFKKALDCIPRHILLSKIERAGVKGNFLSIIR